MAGLGPGGAAEPRPLLVKIVMAGESCVGKTSIVRRYMEPGSPPAGSPATSYMATIGIDFKVKPVMFNDRRVKLQIWDTAGQERFHTLSTSYFRGAQGFVLVYDITNLKSFQSITVWINDIYEAGDEVDVILLGNKCDKESERVVPKQKGEKKEIIISSPLAWEFGMPFFETSAKENVNIEHAFSVLTKEILEKKSGVLHDLDIVSLNETKKRSCCAF
ncbi:ras-related protein Rab-10-like isoform X2 [Vidua macroura]|uniref:ras-related protein Rab-10-like isoform X2 n=1 Tax=Vidua chalybeata TaxID=81927 RepID=UPI0023A8266C|nr:ras-related protein Rab-10-like isoform X2 [Vidua chalybeata]XP_053854256.1 ras-related protein Rab-10-like isoform X2 [Vidua macroura]